MTNNDIIRQLRYALGLSDGQLVTLFGHSAQGMTEADAVALIGKEEEEGTVPCSDDLLADFLDNFILERRGPPKEGTPPQVRSEITNNVVLKKVRIALTLHEGDMLKIIENGGQPFSKSELSALFRKPGHKHFRPCGNQLMRAFLRGLTLRYHT